MFTFCFWSPEDVCLYSCKMLHFVHQPVVNCVFCNLMLTQWCTVGHFFVERTKIIFRHRLMEMSLFRSMSYQQSFIITLLEGRNGKNAGFSQSSFLQTFCRHALFIKPGMHFKECTLSLFSMNKTSVIHQLVQYVLI